MKKIIALVLTLALVFCIGSLAYADQPTDIYAELAPVELIGGDTAGVGAAAQLCGELIAEKVSEITGGKLTINYFPNGQLGSDADLQQQMLDGDIDMVLCQTAPTVSFVPEVAVFDLPCVFAAYDPETIDYVLNDSAFSTALAEKYAAKGINILGFLQGATYRLTSSNKALNSLDDFKGLGIRTMENTYHMAFWKNWGANPTPYAWGEVYFALETGVFEAEENAADTIIGASLYEVQDYLCLTNHILYCNQVMISQNKYNELAPEYQNALNEAVDYALGEIGAKLSQINDDNVKACQEKGMELISYDEAFYNSLKELAAPTYEMVANDVGSDLVEQLQSELEAAAK